MKKMLSFIIITCFIFVFSSAPAKASTTTVTYSGMTFSITETGNQRRVTSGSDVAVYSKTSKVISLNGEALGVVTGDGNIIIPNQDEYLPMNAIEHSNQNIHGNYWYHEVYFSSSGIRTFSIDTPGRSALHGTISNQNNNKYDQFRLTVDNLRTKELQTAFALGASTIITAAALWNTIFNREWFEKSVTKTLRQFIALGLTVGVGLSSNYTWINNYIEVRTLRSRAKTYHRELALGLY